MVHWLLYVSMLLCLAFVLLEMVARTNALVGFAKAAAVIFQGAWLIQLARIEFEGEAGWLGMRGRLG